MKTYLPIQARRASECVHWPRHKMHALAGASGSSWYVFTCRSPEASVYGSQLPLWRFLDRY